MISVYKCNGAVPHTDDFLWSLVRTFPSPIPSRLQKKLESKGFMLVDTDSNNTPIQIVQTYSEEYDGWVTRRIYSERS